MNHSRKVPWLANNRALRAALGEVGIARADLIQVALPANSRFAGRSRWETGKDASDNEFARNAGHVDSVLLLGELYESQGKRAEAAALYFDTARRTDLSDQDRQRLLQKLRCFSLGGIL